MPILLVLSPFFKGCSRVLTRKVIGMWSRSKALNRIYGVLVPALFVACGDFKAPTSHEPITDPAQLYMALTLDHRAINLSTASPYNTIQLTATPRNALGEALTDLPAPTFRSSQPLRVRVSQDGRVEALQPGTGILVIGELAVEGNVRHADTAVVNVTANAAPPVLASFELDPVPPDSTVWGLPGSFAGAGPFLFTLQAAGIDPALRLTVRALDPAGNPITGLEIEYQSLDPSVGRLHPIFGHVELFHLGRVRMVARTTAYGVTMADTVMFTVKLPVYQVVNLYAATREQGAIEPSEVSVRPGGWVFWRNTGGQLADVTFDDPTNVIEPTAVCDAFEVSNATVVQLLYGGDYPCGAGNIPAFYDNNTDFPGIDVYSFRVRQFPVPGVYPYRNTLTGAAGRIVVTDG